MKKLGMYNSARWGRVRIYQGTYGSHDGPTAIVLELDNGEPLATLSVNLYRPECSQDSRDLPRDCFYAKTWSENEALIPDLLASGLFVQRNDLPMGRSGFVTAPVWQIVQPKELP